MAEIVGAAASVITLAGLFKGCIDAFELIKCARNQGLELKKLSLKLSIERCRLLVWGKSMGLSADSENVQHVLKDCGFQPIIHDTLQLVIQLFTDSHQLANKYGCHFIECSDLATQQLEWESETPAGRLNAAFDKLKIGLRTPGARARRTGGWVVQDRKKFTLLVGEIRELIDGLQDITKGIVNRRQQDQYMASGISDVQDPHTLAMISEVCATDHPNFSDAASYRTDALSVAPTGLRDVAEWNDETQLADGTSLLIDQMENWTVTDYRSKVFELLKKISESTEPTPRSFACEYCRLSFTTLADLLDHTKEVQCPVSFCLRSFGCTTQMSRHADLNHLFVGPREEQALRSEPCFPGLVPLGTPPTLSTTSVRSEWSLFPFHLEQSGMEGRDEASNPPQTCSWTSSTSASQQPVLNNPYANQSGLWTKNDDSTQQRVQSCIYPNLIALWTINDDSTLLDAKSRGLGWNEIHQRFFPYKSGSACRKRHERLMVKLRTTELDNTGIELVMTTLKSPGVVM